jgi:hypothetical protein
VRPGSLLTAVNWKCRKCCRIHYFHPTELGFGFAAGCVGANIAFAMSAGEGKQLDEDSLVADTRVEADGAVGEGIAPGMGLSNVAKVSTPEPATTAGPSFVMEYVPGETLCNRDRYLHFLHFPRR